MGRIDHARHVASNPNRRYQVISMDYAYFAQSGNGNAVLVVHGDETESMMAFAVPGKGG